MQSCYILVALVWISWLCSILIIAHCDFMKTTTMRGIFSEVGDDDTTAQYTTTSYGLFSRPFLDDDETYLGCIRYSSTFDAVDTSSDTKLHMGQTFSIFTLLLLSMSSVLVVNVVVWGYCSEVSWKLAHRICICATLTQMLTFCALGSERCTLMGGCTISRNGKVAVLNTVLLAALSLSWFYIPYPKRVFLKLRQKLSVMYDTAVANPQRALSTAEQQRGTDSKGNDWMMETIDDTESVISDILPPNENFDIHTVSNRSMGWRHLCMTLQDNFYVRLITVVAIIIAWTVSILGIQRCTFVFVGYTGEEDAAGSSGLGLFSLAIQDRDDENGPSSFLGCVAYPDHAVDSLDGPFRTARAFGVLTTLLTTGILVLGLLSLLMRSGMQLIWMALRIVVPLSIFTQMLAFVVFRSDVCHIEEGQVDCRLGGTGKLVICNILLFLALAVFLFLVPAPSTPVFEIVSSEEFDDEREGKDVRTAVREKSEPIRSEERIRPPYVENLSERWLSFSQSPNRVSPKSIPAPYAHSCPDPPVVANGKKKTKHEDVDDVPEISSIYLSVVENGKKKTKHEDVDDVPEISSITVQVEYTSTEKKTRKITKYRDGSQTISTTIEELCDMILDDDEDDDDYIAVLE